MARIERTRDRTITLAGAGHPPPLVIGPGGAEPRPVETDGSLLGVFSDDEFTQTTFALALSLYTT